MEYDKELAKQIFLMAISVSDDFCVQYPKPKSLTDDEYKNEIMFESIFLFIHLVSRDVLDRLGLEKRNTLIDKVTMYIVNSYIHLKIPNSSENDKDTLRNGIYANLNERESRYGRCDIITGDNFQPFDNSVFAVFSRNIVNNLFESNDMSFVNGVSIFFREFWLRHRKVFN